MSDRPHDEDVKKEIEAHKEVLAHIKRFLMVKAHEIQTEILRLESAIYDPTKVLSGGGGQQ